MKRTSLVTQVGTGVFLSFLAAACGKNDQAASAEPPAALVHSDIEATHNHSAQAKAEQAPAPASEKNGFDGMPAPGTSAYCPVMKNDFKVTADSTHSVYKGKTYVFCCPGCKPQFDENPEKFIRM